MGLLDALLKQLVAGDARAVAEWLPVAPIASCEPLTVELPGEAVRPDAVFRVQLANGMALLLHLECQGRRSDPPMRWRTQYFQCAQRAPREGKSWTSNLTW